MPPTCRRTAYHGEGRLSTNFPDAVTFTCPSCSSSALSIAVTVYD
jgi:hypothetical protein